MSEPEYFPHSTLSLPSPDSSFDWDDSSCSDFSTEAQPFTPLATSSPIPDEVSENSPEPVDDSIVTFSTGDDILLQFQGHSEYFEFLDTHDCVLVESPNILWGPSCFHINPHEMLRLFQANHR